MPRVTRRAGDMDCRIQIQERLTTIDVSGDQSISYNTIAIRWASKEVLSGREFFANQVKSAKVLTKFGLDYFEGLIPAMRILWQGHIYDITSVEPDSRKRVMTVMTEEVVSR